VVYGLRFTSTNVAGCRRRRRSMWVSTSRLIIGATFIFYTSHTLQYCSMTPTRGCSGGPLLVSAISPSLRPHLATSDLPCYCKKLKFLHVACIVGSRVRVQAEVILVWS